jgi:CRP/FNR family cyclic AMP-dependent transcriptional regulator
MAKTEELVSFLANVSLFQELNNRQLKKIADRFTPRTYQTDDVIIKQGKSGFGMFTIISGRAKAVLELADGSKTVVNEFGPADFFGEVTMLDGGPRTVSVIAREKTECLVLGRVEFISLLREDAEMATEIAVALAQRLRRTVGTS